MNKKLVIEINLDNDAFKPSCYPEVIRILNLYVKRISEGMRMNVNFMDINGNTTGYAAVMERKGT